ncbi:hypothetical protein [Clostridium sp. BJN0001]|uniref:hypothetical protein n=1 Tax=Clostridium sp. BJN0001 TaxID=2930219 RepID=UPI001FD0CE68|nr:hypothetical protein [Clostridium sp. BJN0001]
MGRPSIFSKEYEKRMKRRKKNITLIVVVLLLAVLVVGIKFLIKPIKTSNIRDKLQAWIDSDAEYNKTSVDDIEQNEKPSQSEDTSEDSKSESEENESKKETVDLVLNDGTTLKASYETDSEDKKIFTEVDTSGSDIYYDISPSKQSIIVLDKTQNMILYDANGNNKIITKNQYVSSKGSSFNKDDILNTNPSYIWNESPKFLSDNKIIFVTNRPYFGTSANNQYIWITDLNTNQDIVLWNNKGRSISIGNKDDKGIAVEIDGKSFHVDTDGNILND